MSEQEARALNSASEGQQNAPPRNMPLWQKGCFELIKIRREGEAQKTEKLSFCKGRLH